MTALAGLFEEPGRMERLCALFDMIDETHLGESGSIVFGGQSRGVILVQSGRVCWASSPALTTRLSHRLQGEALDDRLFASVFRECRDTGKPFGQTLVARGVVTFDALRAALLQHTAETLLHLADDPSPRWVPSPVSRYDRNFTFSSTELLAHSADAWWGPLATEARAQLAVALGGRGAVGLAFLKEATESVDAVVPVAVADAGELTAREVLAAGRAAATLMRSAWKLGVRFVTRTFAGGRTSILWVDGGVLYVAVAAERSEVAFILAHLSRRAVP